MNDERVIAHCENLCGKTIFTKEINGKIVQFENYSCTKRHTKYRCDVFKEYKPFFNKLIDDLSRVRQDVQKINEVMFS